MSARVMTLYRELYHQEGLFLFCRRVGSLLLVTLLSQRRSAACCSVWQVSSRSWSWLHTVRRQATYSCTGKNVTRTLQGEWQTARTLQGDRPTSCTVQGDSKDHARLQGDSKRHARLQGDRKRHAWYRLRGKRHARLQGEGQTSSTLHDDM